MKILYRISDGGMNKVKPAYVHDKQKMFIHFITIFKYHDIFVFADNVHETTYQFLKENFDESKIIRTSLGSKSFKYSLDFAISHFNNEDKIYFAEDDYIYKKIAPQIIEEGLEISDYCSGYDHPDKYMNTDEGGPNPFIQLGGELTRVILSKNTHWKFTNSFCLTFATTLKIIKEDYNVFDKYCQWADFNIFSELKTYRKLISCIPGVSTHGETEFLGKFVDWDEEFASNQRI